MPCPLSVPQTELEENEVNSSRHLLSHQAQLELEPELGFLEEGAEAWGGEGVCLSFLELVEVRAGIESKWNQVCVGVGWGGERMGVCFCQNL